MTVLITEVNTSVKFLVNWTDHKHLPINSFVGKKPRC